MLSGMVGPAGAPGPVLYSPEYIEQLVSVMADEIYKMKKMKPGIKGR